jgi:hypothetical protein
VCKANLIRQLPLVQKYVVCSSEHWNGEADLIRQAVHYSSDHWNGKAEGK